jgi:hypothetical protein
MGENSSNLVALIGIVKRSETLFDYLKDRLAHKRPSLNASSSAIGTQSV